MTSATNMDQLMHDLVARQTKTPAEATRRDPQPGPIDCVFVSVDDHLCEPPTTFTGRLPARFADVTPHVEHGETVDHWVFGDERFPVKPADGATTWVSADKDL